MKFIFIPLFVFTFFSCTSNSSKSVEDTGSKIETGVQNVNGNIPDTTNSINLSTHKKDTVLKSKDSVK